MATKRVTITDPAEDAALLAARAYYHSANYGGYDNFVTDALRRAGHPELADMRTQGHPVTLDTAALGAWLTGELAGVRVTAPDAQTSVVADVFYRTLRSRQLADSLYTKIVEGAIGYTVATVTPTFDYGALLTKYNGAGAMPTASGQHAAEIETQRRAMVAAFTLAAEAGHLCGSFETVLREAGLDSYGPPRQAEVSTEVEGFGTMTVTVPLSRSGRITEELLRQYLYDGVRDVLYSRIQLDTVAGLPEGALRTA